MKKKILVACGAGVCTSTVALQKLQAKLEEEGLKDQVTYGQCSVADLPMNAGSYDVVVTTSRGQGNYGTPVVFGLPFITQIGMDDCVDEILDVLGL